MQTGVVTPYGAQARLLRRMLHRVGIKTGRDFGGVEVNSVDSFQGREKEAIVMSTVRASPNSGIGFTADWRRVNVAFTRARRGLVVVCNPTTLAREDRTWAPWLTWVSEQGLSCGPLPALPPPNPAAEPVGLASLATRTPSPPRGANGRSRSPARGRKAAINAAAAAATAAATAAIHTAPPTAVSTSFNASMAYLRAKPKSAPVPWGGAGRVASNWYPAHGVQFPQVPAPDQESSDSEDGDSGVSVEEECVIDAEPRLSDFVF
mmetsp:Transcript_55871/g.107822  ORF Transcript_55871/g.107822 Transcript_55871/m.107822 type:complete len:263 (+) Transcript_55871:245-1033(+)